VPAQGDLDALLADVLVEAVAPGDTPDVVVRSGC
jgi:hypothetical protein